MPDNPFMKKIGPNKYHCLFGASLEEASSIFAGGGGGRADGLIGVKGWKNGPVELVYSDSKHDEFKNRSIPTITSIIKNSRAVKIKIEIENADGTVTKAELL